MSYGSLSPLDGVVPDDSKIRELLACTPMREVILAMNPSVEGDATALYLVRLLKPLWIRTTQLAHGLPVGGTLEYTDRQTIGRALENRMEYELSELHQLRHQRDQLQDCLLLYGGTQRQIHQRSIHLRTHSTEQSRQARDTEHRE